MDFSQPEGHHLAQLNVAKALDDLESPRLADFMSAIDRVNAVAERSPGFVWRLKNDIANNATDIQVTDDPRFIVNMSVWETPEYLEKFVWNTIHKRVYEKKAKWFDAPSEAHFVMWWVKIGTEPTTEEAIERLEYLREHGPTPGAFGWESLPNVKLWQSNRCA